eukprot:1265326-Rhodomonas_salina.1
MELELELELSSREKLCRASARLTLRYSDRARTTFMTAWQWIAVLCGSSIPIAWRFSSHRCSGTEP